MSQASGDVEPGFVLEPISEDRFRARLSGFGGHTLAAATLAAVTSCKEQRLHAFQASFLRAVPDGPVELQVEKLSEGRRFSRRRVTIDHDDRLRFQMLASFAAPAKGPELEEPAEGMPSVQPEDLPSEEEVARAEGWDWWDSGLLEWRWIDEPWKRDLPSRSSSYQAWIHFDSSGADPAKELASLAMLSDIHSHWPVARRLGGHFEPEGYTSLDQMLWIHRDEPWQDWRLLTSVCDVGHAGRALSRRTLRARDGRLVASMAQESLIPESAPLG